MKKKLNSQSAKLLAKKRTKHNLERKEHHYKAKQLEISKYASLNAGYTPPKPRKIPSPKVFSFIENVEESMGFLNKCKKQIEELNNDIQQDFKHIDRVTPDAILYMMSYIEDMKFRKVSFTINGTFPSKIDCRKIFHESGFLERLKSSEDDFNDINTDILSIRVGKKTESKVAQEVVKYVRKWLDISRLDTKPIYKILIECMTNTANHAFETNDNKKWYLMAYHNNGEVHFVFLDNGYGMAKTIRTDWKDLFSGKRFNDSKLVLSALEGEILRSQTGEVKRGKGLPYIYKNSKEKHIKELIIITNKGFINCKNDKTKSLENQFHGTLISWKITKEDFNG